MYVCAHVCLHGNVHMSMHVQARGCLPPLLSTLFFETESFTEPGANQLPILAGQSSCCCLPRVVVTGTHHISSGILNLVGPHACKEVTLLTEPFFQPRINYTF